MLYTLFFHLLSMELHSKELQSKTSRNIGIFLKGILIPRKKVFHNSKVNIQFFCYIDVLHTISSAPGMANTL